MTTSPSRNLCKPTGRQKIPSGTLAYIRTRNRMRMFTVVRQELKKAGITKAELADRLGRGADQINHWLATPGNWTLDTVSDLLFGTTGAELPANVSYPLGQAEKTPDGVAVAEEKEFQSASSAAAPKLVVIKKSEQDK